jgi:hypothetical protein
MSAAADARGGPDRSEPQNPQFDPLAHINPLSPTFFQDCATAAAYLINGKGHWLELGRCVLTAALMHHTIQAARENRTFSLSEVHAALTEASRKIRSRARNLSH